MSKQWSASNSLHTVIAPPSNGHNAAMMSGGSTWTAAGGGGSRGSVGIGGPVWSSGSTSVGVGAWSNYGKGVPSNPGIGASFRFKF